jgi:hypothetical protein
MSPQFDCGFDRAIKEIFVGIIATIFVYYIVDTGLLPLNFIWLFHLSNIICMIILIEKMSYWGSSYLLGWVVCGIIFITTDLLSVLDLLIYFVVPVYFIVKRWFSQ